MSTPVLQVEGLRRAFGGLVAVADLGFEVAAGEVMGLIGPNGSGKTTALGLISGLLAPQAGSVRLQARTITGWAAHRTARAGIARTFQLVRVLPEMSCRDNVLLAMAHGSRPRWGSAAAHDCEHLLQHVGLAGAADRQADALTYIDQKRLELARALALEPLVLLLDEWLAGLNPSELAIAIALVRAERDRGRAIVLVEHVMDAVHALCDHCVVMNAGAVIARGTPQAVLSDPEVVRAYLGADDDA